MFEYNTRPPGQPDYYQVLGVGRSASADDIKKAFFEEAKKCHPDTHLNDKAAEDRFKEINDAYQVLSDKEKKARYDRFSASPPPATDYKNTYGQPPATTVWDFLDPSFRNAWESFFGGSRRSETNSQQENLRRHISALRTLIGGATSFDQVITNFKNWSMMPGAKEAFRQNFFLSHPNQANEISLPIQSVYKICIGITEDPKHIETFETLLDQAAQYNHDPVAKHLKDLVAQLKTARPATSRPERPRPEPPHRDPPKQETSRRETPKPETAPDLEKMNQAFENLLVNLMDVATLEATIKTLKNWIANYTTYQNSRVLPFDSFSPKELLDELEKFTTGKLTQISHSRLLQESSPIAMGVRNLVKNYLAQAAPATEATPRASTTATSEPETVAPAPDPELAGSKELLELRAELQRTTTLSEAVTLLQQKPLTELVCLKPEILPSRLKRILEAVSGKQMTYDQIPFFTDIQKLGKDASPVAKHLLNLAQTGKF